MFSELERATAAGIAPSKPVTFHRPELDILRFCAFLMIFSYHALGWIPIWFTGKNIVIAFGMRGVDVFFALSAYLITEILLRERRKRGSINLRNFYVRRILRIWPLYFSFLLFTFFVVPYFLPGDSFPGPSRLAFLVFLGNWNFPMPGMRSIAAILWSVSLEEQFYLTWPMLVRASERWYRPVCIGLIGLGIAYRALLMHFHDDGRATSFSTFARLDGIICGALLAFVLQGRMPRLSARRAAALLLGGCLVMAAVELAPPWASSVVNTIVGGCCVAILVAFMALRFHNPLLEYLGKISYGLYVFHTLALTISKELFPARNAPLWMFQCAVALAITIALAAASYRYLESPFLRLKDRFAFVRRS